MKRSSNSYAVIGLGFGDEGKGLTVNSLCRQLPNCLVIRYSGGQQAGHTVTLPDGCKHVFANFGSGTFQGAPTYWSKYCTFDPVGAVREYNVLLTKGVKPRLYLDARCPITTPYDMLFNQTVSDAMKHGTCGAGVGATYAREEKFYSLTVSDLYHPTAFKIKLDMIRQFYGTDVDLEEFLAACEKAQELFHTVECVPWSENYVFEGSQGLMLDQNIGFFPHVTRSNTGTKNILQIISEGVNIGRPELFLVTRAFQTRHGNGPMTTSHLPHNIASNPHETNVENDFQGNFRRGLLDLDLLLYAIEKDEYIRNASAKHLVITCLDLIKNEYRYVFDDKVWSQLDEDGFVDSISYFLGIWLVHRVSSPDGEIDAFPEAAERKIK